MKKRPASKKATKKKRVVRPQPAPDVTGLTGITDLKSMCDKIIAHREPKFPVASIVALLESLTSRQVTDILWLLSKRQGQVFMSVYRSVREHDLQK